MNDRPKAGAYLKQGRQVWLWVIPQCPYCGGEHVHGGGAFGGDPRRLLGSRVPHCTPTRDDGQYDLVEIPKPEKAARKRAR